MADDYQTAAAAIHEWLPDAKTNHAKLRTLRNEIKDQFEHAIAAAGDDLPEGFRDELDSTLAELDARCTELQEQIDRAGHILEAAGNGG